MLYFVVVWTFLFLICFGSGTTLLGVLKADCFERRGDRLVVAIWLGITMLSVVFLSISLFVPLSLSITLPIALAAAGLPFLFPQFRAEIVTLFSPRAMAFWFTLEFGVAFFMAKKVTWYDSGFYHVSKIRWLAEYGTVPGLYLIQDRFGWTSSWFALSAVLNPSFVDYRATAIANGFILVIMLLHFFLSMKRIARGEARLADWFAAIAYVLLLPVLLNKNLPLTDQKEKPIFALLDQENNFIAELVISPSHDVPIILLVIVIAWTMLIISERQSWLPSASPLDVRTIPLLLAGGATTIKLTGIGLLLVALPFYCFSKRFWWQRIFWGILLSLLLLAPMFASGIITSACPIYPSLFMCLKLPWSNNPHYLNNLGLWWKDHTLLGHPSKDENFWWWLLQEWFEKSNINKIIIFCSIFALILLIWLFIWKRRQLASFSWVLILGLVGSFMILSQAPDTRYGLGYFLLIPCSIMGAFCYVTLNPQKINLIEGLPAFLPPRWLSSTHPLFLFSLALIGVLSFQGIKESRFLLPPPLPQIRVFSARVNNIEYYQPLRPDVCWATKLPCSHDFLSHSLRLWKPKQGIRGGFTRSRPKTE